MALSVPLSRFASRVGGGSAFFVRQQSVAEDFAVGFRGGVFGGSVLVRKLPVSWQLSEVRRRVLV